MKRFLPYLNSNVKTTVLLRSGMKALFTFCFFIFGVSTFGQTSIWTNPITGTNPAAANPYTTGQTVNSNLTVSGIGYATVTALTSTNTYNTGDWTTSATINTGQYFSFTITPSAGYKVSMNNFVYTGTSGSRAPTSFAFRSNAAANNFATNIGTPTAAGTTISLSGTNYQDLSTATSFRFYGFNSTSGSAATRAYAINDFTFNGSVLGSATTSLTFGSNAYGSAPVQTFQVNGNGLIPANATITVNGSTNYEVSTTSSSSGFGATATLTASGGNLSGANVWVRLKATSAVGTYNENITFGGGGVTGITIACSGTVTTRALTVTADNGSKTYGQTYTVGSGSTAFTSSGLQNGETIGTVTIASTGAVATAAAGSHNIVPSAATGGTFTASNYAITYPNGTLTISTAPLTVTANNANKVYGITQSTPVSGSTAFGSIGLQNGETIGTVTLTYGAGALAGTDAVGSTSTITPSAAIGGTFTASNYNITYTPNSGTLTVTAATLTITANNDNKVYGQTYTVGSGSTAFTSSGLQNGETIGSITTSSAGAVNTAAVGTYSIIPTLAIGGTFTASNYSITYNNGTLTVNPATLTITADSGSKNYGQTYTVGSGSSAFTSSGLQNSETIGSITIASTGAVATAAVGSYSIIASAATGGSFTASNYSVTYNDGTLTVNAASLTITANNDAKVYGITQTTPQSGSTAFGSTGLQNGETIGTVTLTFGTGALAASDPVGSTSTITASAATGGTFTASNYNITYTPNSGTLTVAVATLIITANNDSKVYGTTQSTPVVGSTAFGSTGLVNGETIGTVTLTYGSGALAATDAVGSTSTITASAATGGTFTASNYSITYNNGTLTVTAAPLTITADNASKCFGTTYTLGTSAFTSSGLQNSETIGSVTLTSSGATSGAAVGSYAITPSVAIGGSFTSSNYNITYTDGTLTVIALPNAPTGTDGAICSAGTVNLSATVSGGETVDWYDASSGGTLLLSNSTSYTTPSISSTTIYYAEARNTTTGCVSATRTAVTASVYTTFTSGAILTTGETVCYNGDPTSIGNATIASGGDESITYKWQANGNDIPSSNSASYDPPAGLTATTTYTRYAKDNTCNATFTLSSGTWVVTVSNNNTWTGGVSTSWTNPANWSCGVLPASVSDVTIASATFYPEISSSVSINTLTMNSGTTLKVNTLYDLTVTDVITNNGTLTLENNANLIQTNNVANTGSGSTVVKRNSSAIMRFDYTLWSSPVSGQGLYAFSPFTFANRFYQYNTSSNTYSSVSGFNITGLNGAGVNGVDNNNVQFSTGVGYLIRMPYNHPTTPTIWTGNFTGTPNNGDKTVALNNIGAGQRFNLVGNPYPSPLDAIALVTDTNNAANITGTLYFLRKTNSNINSSYSTWTQGGFVTNGGAAVFDPNDVIQTGQGFIVEATATGSALEFNNSMRINDHANQFFRSNNTIERNRIWLNATNASGLFSQTMVGYLTNATNDVDHSIDGKYLADGDIALTSLIGTTPYAIQGRALPFDNTDVVPLNFRVTNAGQYSIAIDHVDGLFVNGTEVFLRDNLLSIVRNLNTGAYTFTSDAGTFDSRFEILYQMPLGVTSPVFNANQVIIYKNSGNDFVINSGNVVMATAKVFDIRGRLLLEKNEINNSETIISAGQTNEVLLIQITSQDGLVVTKKIIR